ncbi:putative MULE transposase domain-containing protein [Medicago truncatula]|uniref:Putative MULE transposase domain-containing protein n=2 Tax=Medicago truncatula TaxID=3880 RepID=A0A396GWS7_MEDTR|nr:putative MULE transposase domain-containing protein [Medicago truncatula]
MKDMRREHAVGITKGMACKTKQIAKTVVEGDASRQYSMLWRYAAELKRVCAGNNCKINMERPAPTLQPRFSRFYFCFDGCKKGFTSACRPFIGVDGCHLKTKYGGQLLVAVGRDPNDQYFPLAFGVVETETKDSWSWFLQLLLEDVGQDKRYVFISDQQKGLIQVLEEKAQTIDHRLCLRHLYANFKKKFGGGTLIRDLMMGAAKTTYYQGWEQKMNELKNVDRDA